MLANRRFKILLIFLICVGCSFWLVSRYPALDTKAALSGMEAFEDPLTNEAHFHASRNADFYTRVMITTLNWYETNWRGMVFGLVIAAGFSGHGFGIGPMTSLLVRDLVLGDTPRLPLNAFQRSRFQGQEA